MSALVRAASWTRWELNPDQEASLIRFGEWLAAEAIPAGGVGPDESERLLPRHVADSLLFAAGWSRADPPRSIIDLGTGVGLPGIPLAILWPDTKVTLLDRAGRRVQLARRAARILALDNVAIEESDAETWTGGPYDMIVARAAAGADLVREWAQRLVAPDGVIIVGGSWTSPPPEDDETLVVPFEVLDREVWLRKMAPA